MIILNGKQYQQVTDNLLVGEDGDIIKLHHLKQTVQQSSGYHTVQGLQKELGIYTTTVSRLVYEAFKGKIPKNYKVMHKDKNLSNNHIDNLYLEITCKAKKDNKLNIL